MKAKIKYREFYDIPRVFLVKYKEKLFLFESVFKEDIDDYSNYYDIYLMPVLSDEEIEGSWEHINNKAMKKVGKVPVNEVKFDRTLRKEINTKVLEKISKLYDIL